MLNVSAALGRILVGFAADRVGPVNALFVAIAASGLTQLVVWMFVTTYAGIVSGFFFLSSLPLLFSSSFSFWGNHLAWYRNARNGS